MKTLLTLFFMISYSLPSAAVKLDQFELNGFSVSSKETDGVFFAIPVELNVKYAGTGNVYEAEFKWLFKSSCIELDRFHHYTEAEVLMNKVILKTTYSENAHEGCIMIMPMYIEIFSLMLEFGQSYEIYSEDGAGRLFLLGSINTNHLDSSN